MKPLKTVASRLSLLAFIFGVNFPQSGLSQCTTLKSISYDTLVNGNGNATFTIKLPQFDPGKGTLAAVKVTSVISLQYGFQLENNSRGAASYMLGVGRNDYIAVSALSQGLFNMDSIMKYYGPYTLAGSNGVAGSGADFINVPAFSVLSDYLDISDSITSDIAGFIGNGKVEYDYYATTYYSLSGNYTFNYNASDSVDLTVTYYYCDKPVVRPSVTSFNALMQGASTVDLVWETLHEQPDRDYTIQKSSDGINFEDLTAIPSGSDSALANYFYGYRVTAKDTSELYFRIKITDTTSNVEYTAVRAVKLPGVEAGPTVLSKLSLYPNPSNTDVNIVFNQLNSNWQVDIITSEGVVLQRYSFNSTSQGHIGFVKKLPPGMYFIHAFDLTLQKSYVLPFMMQ